MKSTESAPLANRLDDARRAVYREHILSVAEDEFGRVGFAAAKVGDIAAGAGVSLSTVYKSFGSKDDLWDALNAERMKEFTQVVHAGTRLIDSPFERLLVGARLELEFFAERDSFLRLHLNDGLSWGTASVIPGAGRGAQRDAWKVGMELTAASAQAAADAGEIRPLRPSVVAALVISALQVWLTDWVAHDRDRPISVVADEVVDHLRSCLAAT
ncbi:TetR/AcrR family transcriptional regulator [Nocardioides marmoriginsengisoli]|uniref:TetR/AcrR family transcriptional regulator n=1 Tax=Nocardioides marmoriginsengisoli TaxID=661483 RepID=UPI001C82F6CD|nr:TetR/AcrR family transcriptional regulator [Nocardioides marmoriginsengisoli]